MMKSKKKSMISHLRAALESLQSDKIAGPEDPYIVHQEFTHRFSINEPPVQVKIVSRRPRKPKQAVTRLRPPSPKRLPSSTSETKSKSLSRRTQPSFTEQPPKRIIKRKRKHHTPKKQDELDLNYACFLVTRQSHMRMLQRYFEQWNTAVIAKLRKKVQEIQSSSQKKFINTQTQFSHMSKGPVSNSSSSSSSFILKCNSDDEAENFYRHLEEESTDTEDEKDFTISRFESIIETIPDTIVDDIFSDNAEEEDIIEKVDPCERGMLKWLCHQRARQMARDEILQGIINTIEKNPRPSNSPTKKKKHSPSHNKSPLVVSRPKPYSQPVIDKYENKNKKPTISKKEKEIKPTINKKDQVNRPISTEETFKTINKKDEKQNAPKLIVQQIEQHKDMKPNKIENNLDTNDQSISEESVSSDNYVTNEQPDNKKNQKEPIEKQQEQKEEKEIYDQKPTIESEASDIVISSDNFSDHKPENTIEEDPKSYSDVSQDIIDDDKPNNDEQTKTKAFEESASSSFEVDVVGSSEDQNIIKDDSKEQIVQDNKIENIDKQNNQESSDSLKDSSNVEFNFEEDIIEQKDVIDNNSKSSSSEDLQMDEEPEEEIEHAPEITNDQKPEKENSSSMNIDFSHSDSMEDIKSNEENTVEQQDKEQSDDDDQFLENENKARMETNQSNDQIKDLTISSSSAEISVEEIEETKNKQDTSPEEIILSNDDDAKDVISDGFHSIPEEEKDAKEEDKKDQVEVDISEGLQSISDDISIEEEKEKAEEINNQDDFNISVSTSKDIHVENEKDANEEKKEEVEVNVSEGFESMPEEYSIEEEKDVNEAKKEVEINVSNNSQPKSDEISIEEEIIKPKEINGEKNEQIEINESNSMSEEIFIDDENDIKEENKEEIEVNVSNSMSEDIPIEEENVEVEEKKEDVEIIGSDGFESVSEDISVDEEVEKPEEKKDEKVVDVSDGFKSMSDDISINEEEEKNKIEDVKEENSDEIDLDFASESSDSEAREVIHTDAEQDKKTDIEIKPESSGEIKVEDIESNDEKDVIGTISDDDKNKANASLSDEFVSIDMSDKEEEIKEEKPNQVLHDLNEEIMFYSGNEDDIVVDEKSDEAIPFGNDDSMDLNIDDLGESPVDLKAPMNSPVEDIELSDEIKDIQISSGSDPDIHGSGSGELKDFIIDEPKTLDQIPAQTITPDISSSSEDDPPTKPGITVTPYKFEVIKPEIIKPKKLLPPNTEMRQFISTIYPEDKFNLIRDKKAINAFYPLVEIPDGMQVPWKFQPHQDLIVDFINESNDTLNLSVFTYEKYLDFLEEPFNRDPPVKRKPEPFKVEVRQKEQHQKEMEEINILFHLADKLMSSSLSKTIGSKTK